MGFRRKVDRNGLKGWLKTNKIAEEWHRFQIEKYGLATYEDMQRANRKKRKDNRKNSK